MPLVSVALRLAERESSLGERAESRARRRRATQTSIVLVLFLFTAASARAARAAESQPHEYRLGPEDVLWVFVWKEPELCSTVTIRPDGKITLPLVGQLHAGRKTAKELGEEITRELRQYLHRPVVSVIVKEVNSPKISVLGKVRKPDAYVIRSETTVLEAIALAGGFRENATPGRVIIFRNSSSSKHRMEVDLKRLLADDESGQIFLRPSDTVYVRD